MVSVYFCEFSWPTVVLILATASTVTRESIAKLIGTSAGRTLASTVARAMTASLRIIAPASTVS